MPQEMLHDIISKISANPEALKTAITILLTFALTKFLPALLATLKSSLTWLGGRIGGRFSYNSFQQQYLDWLVTDLQELRLTGIVSAEDSKRPKLDQVYLSLRLENTNTIETINPPHNSNSATLNIKTWQDATDLLRTHEQCCRNKPQETSFTSPPTLAHLKKSLRAAKAATKKLPSTDPTTSEEHSVKQWIASNLEHFDPTMGDFQLRQLIKNHNKIAILGSPGAGKTTLLQHIALSFARERTGDKKLRRKNSLKNSLGKISWKTPVFIRLTSIASQLATRTDNKPDLTILDALASTLPPDLQALPEAKNYFASQLKKGRCVVLLDGLDEVPSNQEFEATTRAIQSMVAFYPRNKYIITSRIAGWRTGAGPGFQVSYVDDLSDAQIETFVETWYEAVERNAIPGRLEDESPSEKKARSRRANQKAQGLKSTLQTNIGIRRLATNPMLLSIIAVVHRSLATLPRERSKLYNQCSQILLDQWDFSRGLRVDDTGLRLEQKQAIMRRLAYALHTGEIGDPGGGREASSEQFETIISNMLPGLSKPPESASRLLKRLLERSGLLIERSRNSISFAHHTFQEYFTAQYLSDLGSEAGAVFLANKDRILSDWWREVALLLSGLLPDSGHFIKLIERTEVDDIFLRTTRMAALCASEAIAIADKSVRDSIVQKSLSVRQSHNSPRVPQTEPVGDYVLRWAKSTTWLPQAARLTQTISPEIFKSKLRSLTSSKSKSHNPETLEALLVCICSGRQVSINQEELDLLATALSEDNYRYKSLSLKALGRHDIPDLRSNRLDILTAQLIAQDRYVTREAAVSIGNILRSSTPIPKNLITTLRESISANTNEPDLILREITKASKRGKFAEAVFDESTIALTTAI